MLALRSVCPKDTEASLVVLIIGTNSVFPLAHTHISLRPEKAKTSVE